jgi:hypothetical protein
MAEFNEVVNAFFRHVMVPLYVLMAIGRTFPLTNPTERRYADEGKLTPEWQVVWGASGTSCA